MKAVAWLAGIGTLLAGTAYMLVSLNRWEWNRALFFGLIVVIAEIGLATGLVLRKLGQMAAPQQPDPTVVAAIQGSRPPGPARFRWLRDAANGQLNVFITFLVGGGVALSALAWMVDRVASLTTTPIGEERLARRLHTITYPPGVLSADEPPLVRLLRHPG